ncbi:MAG: molybdopterin molybdotransferase MoeA [Thermoprotei archaeon]
MKRWWTDMFSRPEMKRILRLTDVDTALDLAINSFGLDLTVEDVNVEHAVGRILADSIVSNKDYPEFDQAFYDGYAIRSVDTDHVESGLPVRLKIVGRMDTNDKPEKIILKSGEAVFTVSGAPLPLGADAVVRLEEAEVDNDYVIIKRRVNAGETVVMKGHDFKRDDVILSKGTLLRPQDIGLVMELGITRLKVYRKIRTGIMSVGSDLLERANNGVPYPDNYSQIVKHYLKLFGFDVQHYGIVSDDRGEIRERILKAVGENDAVLVVGGVSISSNDLVPDVVNEIGTIVFHGHRISPGKVSGLAIVNKKPVFMIPGHVGSTVAALFLIVVPTLFYKLTGVRDPYVKVKARLIGDVETKPGSYAFRTVSLKYVNGEYEAKPIYKQLGGSPFLTLLVEANGFIIVRPKDKLFVGDTVEVRMFSPIEALRIY